MVIMTTISFASKSPTDTRTNHLALIDYENQLKLYKYFKSPLPSQRKETGNIKIGGRTTIYII